MHKLLWILLGLGALPHRAAAQGQPTMRNLMADSVQVRGAACALFPAIAQLDTLYLHVAGTEPYRFTPSVQQVETTENQLQTGGIRAIRSSFSSADSVNLIYIQAHLAGYKRQYFGFYNAQQQPCFFIQLLLDTDGMYSNWLSGRLLIFDGGASVCELCYNLNTHQFYYFGYHSEG